jgi:hypothetical protein
MLDSAAVREDETGKGTTFSRASSVENYAGFSP